MLSRYNREKRTSLFKYRAAKGFTGGMPWSAWNHWFILQSEDDKQKMYSRMLEDKKEEKMNFMGQDLTATQITERMNTLLDCCPPTCAPCKTTAAIPQAWNKSAVKKQEEEQKMSYNQIDVRVAPIASTDSEIATQRKFLAETLRDLYWTKRHSDDLRRAFGLMDDEAPKTVKERKARIAAGKFIVDFDYDDEDFDEDEEHYGLGRGHIRWRDPAVKEDQAGLTAVQKLIDAENTKTQRIIQIKDADTGLAAIEAFETKTFH